MVRCGTAAATLRSLRCALGPLSVGPRGASLVCPVGTRFVRSAAASCLRSRGSPLACRLQGNRHANGMPLASLRGRTPRFASVVWFGLKPSPIQLATLRCGHSLRFAVPASLSFGTSTAIRGPCYAAFRPSEWPTLCQGIAVQGPRSRPVAPSSRGLRSGIVSGDVSLSSCLPSVPHVVAIRQGFASSSRLCRLSPRWRSAPTVQPSALLPAYPTAANAVTFGAEMTRWVGDFAPLVWSACLSLGRVALQVTEGTNKGDRDATHQHERPKRQRHCVQHR